MMTSYEPKGLKKKVSVSSSISTAMLIHYTLRNPAPNSITSIDMGRLLFKG